MEIAVYPGSFDPVTNGHLDVIERSAAVFNEVVVGVLSNGAKRPLFSVEERMQLLEEVTAHIGNVKIATFSGLLVDFMDKFHARVIIKGLRTISDFEYEFQMALLNKSLKPEVETLFMMTDSKYSYISSSMVKEVARLGGALDGLVPASVATVLRDKLNGRG